MTKRTVARGLVAAVVAALLLIARQGLSGARAFVVPPWRQVVTAPGLTLGVGDAATVCAASLDGTARGTHGSVSVLITGTRKPGWASLDLGMPLSAARRELGPADYERVYAHETHVAWGSLGEEAAISSIVRAGVIQSISVWGMPFRLQSGLGWGDSASEVLHFIPDARLTRVQQVITYSPVPGCSYPWVANVWDALVLAVLYGASVGAMGKAVGRPAYYLGALLGALLWPAAYWVLVIGQASVAALASLATLPPFVMVVFVSLGAAGTSYGLCRAASASRRPRIAPETTVVWMSAASTTGGVIAAALRFTTSLGGLSADPRQLITAVSSWAVTLGLGVGLTALMLGPEAQSRGPGGDEPGDA